MTAVQPDYAAFLAAKRRHTTALKLCEEAGEVGGALLKGEGYAALHEELGDVLGLVVVLAAHSGTSLTALLRDEAVKLENKWPSPPPGNPLRSSRNFNDVAAFRSPQESESA